jgi:hypothetical protein
MPYKHIEELGDRKQERFALGLGAQSVGGIALLVLPVLMLSTEWPLGLRAAGVIGAAALGFLLTMEVSGLALYEWPLWWARGRLRMLAQGRTITPDQLPGVVAQPARAPLRVGGSIRPARRAALGRAGAQAASPDKQTKAEPDARVSAS